MLFLAIMLIALQPADDVLHLLIRVDAEALVLGDACELHVLRVQFLLHDLLQRAKSEGLGF